LARTASGRLVECGSDQNRQDEEDEGSDKTRNQLPARQTDLPKRPDAREGERARVDEESRDPSFDHEVAGGEKHRADQDVIPAPAQRREVSAAARKDQTQQRDERAEKRGRPREVAPPLRRPVSRRGRPCINRRSHFGLLSGYPRRQSDVG